MSFISNINRIAKKVGILGTQEFQNGEEVWIELKEGPVYLATPANIESYNSLTRFFRLKCTDTEAFKALKTEPPIVYSLKSCFSKEKIEFDF